ncbi:AraC family transcriptional regulator [Candidatus Halocynthiibacter alkanivorans]|uniref:AraC family transcriptional regulator n=1 Tax=Candidatus Halocynthiibacter alkanivorans TaxID=2267619 RepID=UPI000DF2FDB8|nr:AraC family transcriptional regulator [Candidatus Halocynthiibacter alkanivorans]
MGINYENRMMRVLDYIHQNPAGDLSLDALADVAALSRFHWHRVFAAITGETCAQAVRRVRLHLGSAKLVHSAASVDQIARDVGYSSVQSFSRAFSESYGMAPNQFRQRGDMTSPLLKVRKGQYPMFPVEINTLEAGVLAGLVHQGSYFEIGSSFEKVAAVVAARNLWPQTRGMAAAYWQDPSAVAESELRSFAGVKWTGEAVPEGLERHEVAAGRYAVMHYKGPYAGLRAAYDHLFGVWLPASGEAPGDQPCLEVYLNDPRETAPDDLLTDVCVVLK